MLNFLRQGIKYFFAIFLFGLVLWANPIEGYCYTEAFTGYFVTKPIPNNTTLPYNYISFFPSEPNTLNPSSYMDYLYFQHDISNVPSSHLNNYSFSVNFKVSAFNSFFDVKCNGSLFCAITVLYYDHSGGSDYLVYRDIASFTFDDNSYHPYYDFNFDCYTPGAPYRLLVMLSTNDISFPTNSPWVFSASDNLDVDLQALNSGGGSYVATMSGSTIGTSGTYSGNSSNESGQWFESYPGSSSGTWSQNGQSSESGNLSIQGVTFTGSVNMQGSSSSDYSGTISEDLLDPSGSSFFFSYFFNLTDFQVSYEENIDTHLNHIDYYESLINSNTSSINNYTSTLVDQFEEFFDYVAPNTQSFNTDKSSTDTMIQSASSIQSGYFDSFSSAVNDTGLDSFDWGEYNPQLTYVSTLLTSVYNTFPNKVKYAIYFILFLGFFAVLINAVSYIVRKRG